MKSLVTAVITTHKRPAEIVKRAVESILNQTYENIEVIVVDDSPSAYEQRDCVKNMVVSMGEKVQYIQNKENIGACASRNIGLKEAKGEFIAFLDDDDEWLPQKIEKQLEVFKQNDKAVLVYCGRYTYYTETDRLEVQKVKFRRGRVFEKLILDNFIGSTSFPLIRTAELRELGGFDEKMKAAQDGELWLRITWKYEVDYVKDPLVRYYVHQGDQITKNHVKKAEAFERLNEKHMEYLKRHTKSHSIRVLRLAMAYSFYDIEKAKKLFKEAVKIYPVLNKDLLRTFKWVYIKNKNQL